VSTVIPSTASERYALPSGDHLEPAGRRRLRLAYGNGILLAAICAVQADLSLTLVGSNTAYIDEADYLWVGHLEIEHWLHGTPWPSAYAFKLFSGSPLIYPPIGALADSLGGLVAARILSMLFMIGATVLLYFTASRLVGARAALIAAALFALSEPAIRLAFATYDPLSIFLTALSAWLVVQAGVRRHGVAYATAGGAALALANMTAYSGIVIDPIVVAMALLVWRPRASAPGAVLRTAWFAGVAAVVFALLMTASHAWPGLLYTVVARNIADYQGAAAILSEILGYAGLVMVLAVIGILAAIRTEPRPRAALLTALGCAAAVVPAAQLHDQTAWSIDKHLAYGIWFAAIAAGYVCSQLIEWLPSSSKRIVALCGVVALAYTAGLSWQSAWQRYHAWPNAAQFIAKFGPLVAKPRHDIYIYVPGHEANIAQYYTPQGREFSRWSAAMSLSPGLTGAALTRYYKYQLAHDGYGIIALFYTTTFSSTTAIGPLLVSEPNGGASRRLLGLVGSNSGEPGLAALTEVLQTDREAYKEAGSGTYDSPHNFGVFIIWTRVGA
jgi:4-amino-4-deoxy-L-arabinose transferase-like glycosyltransferase